MGRILMGEDPLLLSGKHEGDVVLSPGQDPYSVNAEEKNAVGDYSLLWPGGVIPYEFSFGYRMLPFEQFLITRAMRDIERKSCVKFVPRKDEYDYVKIIFDSYKCYSNVGRRGGEQVLSLGIFCVMFYDRGNVYHELFHVLGFHHEHNRPDRDDHVDVMWRNIRREARNNFEKRHPNSVDLLSMPYDIDSVMHYSPHAFSKLYYVLPTLVSHDRGIFFTRSRWPSKLDYNKLNKLYQCHNKTPFYPNQIIR
ncbi:UNVERIFIED_CONTAM: hypothetical protein RMT77_012508 [Armadillidium vulgare]